MITLIDTSFFDDLASANPDPAEGAAAAYVGALAASLSTMVGNLTVGKKRFADVEDLVYNLMEELSFVRDDLLELIEEDADSFRPLFEAYRMPSETPEQAAAKNGAMQEALVAAIETPLAIMRSSCRVIELTETMAQKGCGLAVADAGAAAILAEAALRTASLTVTINVKSVEDERMARKYRREAAEMLAIYSPKADAVVKYVTWKVKYD